MKLCGHKVHYRTCLHAEFRSICMQNEDFTQNMFCWLKFRSVLTCQGLVKKQESYWIIFCFATF